MLIVTNRNIQRGKKGDEFFGKDFNKNGPDELRLAVAKKTGHGWRVDLLDDDFSRDGQDIYASEQAFLDMQTRMRRNKKPCLFFVHGFNNDFKDVLERSRRFERNFGVEVVAFTWPANGRDGGGLLGRAGGTLSYKNDKRDALRSVAALDRAFEKLNLLFQEHSDRTRDCKQRISILLHSMGNYLLKHLMKSSVYQGETALFDNVIMASADVNNKNHADWVDRIAYRRRLYITINESDSALRASRAKTGDNQLARLGHFTQNLYSRNAIYLDFSDARHVGSDHAYFEDEPLKKNPRLRTVFRRMIRGEKGEAGLQYNSHSRTYIVP